MRTDDKLIIALASVQAAPNGFGPEHASLCHDASQRLRELACAMADKERALEGNRELLREVAMAHLVLAEMPADWVSKAIAALAERYPEKAAYLPKLVGDRPFKMMIEDRVDGRKVKGGLTVYDGEEV